MKKLKLGIFILFIFGIVFSIRTFNSYFPLRYLDIINRYSSIHNVDPVLVASIINVESRFNPYAVSHAGASGLMQLMPGTAEWIAETLGIDNFNFNEDIFNPEVNINMGTWYISRLLNNHYDISVALAAYNAGSGNVANWLSDSNFSNDGLTLDYIPFGETRRYVSVVLVSMYAYRFRLWLGWQ